MSQVEIAERLGVPQTTISDWVTKMELSSEIGSPPDSRQHFDLWQFPTVGAEAHSARLGGAVGIDCDGHNDKKQEAETMNTNKPKPALLTEDELKSPAIRLALEIAEWLRTLPPDEQRQMLADFEQHMAECPPNCQPASEALRKYLVRACLH